MSILKDDAAVIANKKAKLKYWIIAAIALGALIAGIVFF